MEYRGGRKNFLILMPPDKQNYTTITLIYNIGIMHQTTINPTVEGYKSEKTTVFLFGTYYPRHYRIHLNLLAVVSNTGHCNNLNIHLLILTKQNAAKCWPHFVLLIFYYEL